MTQSIYISPLVRNNYELRFSSRVTLIAQLTSTDRQHRLDQRLIDNAPVAGDV